jgi:hypothetical protein
MFRGKSVITGALIFLAACLSPDPPDGSILCSPKGKQCPDNYTCAADSKCYRNGGPGGNPDGGSTCQAYCNCMGVACPGFFSDEGSCLNTCQGLSSVALSCRVFHCGLAMQDPTTHCPHAEGKVICP